MGTHTKIIEFYGLPGCGKTTLCNKLKEIYETKGYKVGLLTDASNSVRWYRLLSIISAADILLYFHFFLMLIRSRVHHNLVLSPIRRLLMYKCVKKESDYDYVFIEHGVTQSIIRALHDVSCPLAFLKKTAIEKLLYSIPANVFVYCNVTPDIAFKRVRVRDRKNSGTFDQYPEKQLKNVLEKHFQIFEFAQQQLIENYNCVFEIDCSCNIKESILQVIGFIKK